MKRFKAEQIIHDVVEAAYLNALDIDESKAAEIHKAAEIVFNDLETYAQFRRDSGDPSFNDPDA